MSLRLIACAALLAGSMAGGCANHDSEPQPTAPPPSGSTGINTGVTAPNNPSLPRADRGLDPNRPQRNPGDASTTMPAAQ